MSVRGAVVHDQYFPPGGGKIPRQHALNRFFDKASTRTLRNGVAI
jgi:hypothetical protein